MHVVTIGQEVAVGGAADTRRGEADTRGGPGRPEISGFGLAGILLEELVSWAVVESNGAGELSVSPA